MDKIIQVNELNRLISLSRKKVVVGGCFDILHIGHISFLKHAKAYGDLLIVLLESDQSIRKWKGENRPIHTQRERAEVLTALSMVNYVILLPEMKDDTAYDELLQTINPAVIATTVGDKGIHHKKRQAVLTKSKVIEVAFTPEKSSSEILTMLSKEL